MNKYLMMSAAALMASAGTIPTPASAGTTRIGFSGSCDGFALGSTDGVVFATKHLYTGCGGSYTGALGTSVVGKNKKFGNIYGFNKFLTVTASSGTSYVLGYAIQFPLKSGSKWCSFATTGTNAGWVVNCGRYYTGYSHTKGGRALLKRSSWKANETAKMNGHILTTHSGEHQ